LQVRTPSLMLCLHAFPCKYNYSKSSHTHHQILRNNKPEKRKTPFVTLSKKTTIRMGFLAQSALVFLLECSLADRRVGWIFRNYGKLAYQKFRKYIKQSCAAQEHYESVLTVFVNNRNLNYRSFQLLSTNLTKNHLYHK